MDGRVSELGFDVLGACMKLVGQRAVAVEPVGKKGRVDLGVKLGRHNI